MSDNDAKSLVFTNESSITRISPRRISGSLIQFMALCSQASRGYNTVTIEATADGGVKMYFGRAALEVGRE